MVIRKVRELKLLVPRVFKARKIANWRRGLDERQVQDLAGKVEVRRALEERQDIGVVVWTSEV